jgi:hypothetical protein
LRTKRKETRLKGKAGQLVRESASQKAAALGMVVGRMGVKLALMAVPVATVKVATTF